MRQPPTPGAVADATPSSDLSLSIYHELRGGSVAVAAFLAYSFAARSSPPVWKARAAYSKAKP